MKKDVTIYDAFCSVLYVSNLVMVFFTEDVTLSILIMSVALSSVVRTIMYHVIGELPLLDVVLFIFWAATALIGVAVMIDGGEGFGLGVMVLALSVMSVIRMLMYYAEK